MSAISRAKQYITYTTVGLTQEDRRSIRMKAKHKHGRGDVEKSRNGKIKRNNILKRLPRCWKKHRITLGGLIFDLLVGMESNQVDHSYYILMYDTEAMQESEEIL